jgi:ubiquinone/menaquinone biosynthesis C-methylase UbiE
MADAPQTSIRPDVEIQRRYYANTASQYDTMHAHEGATDPFAQAYVHSILQMLGVQSLLDVGSATGRGLQDFQKALPGAFVCGLEPVAALVQQARLSAGSAALAMVQASGEALPFSDASFDAVCEFAILHHVPDPAKVLREMMRVSRRVLVVVDCNRFGQGPWPLRILKLILCKLGLWGIFDYIRTRGKRYQISEGDGLFYSYSVFDSYNLIAEWADRVLLIPGEKTEVKSWFNPLLTSQGVILVAIRDVPSPQ